MVQGKTSNIAKALPLKPFVLYGISLANYAGTIRETFPLPNIVRELAIRPVEDHDAAKTLGGADEKQNIIK